MRFLVLFALFFTVACLPAEGDDMYMVSSARKDVTLTGYTRNLKEMMVASEISGRVVRINYDIGDSVGDRPFLELDTTFINLDIANVLTSLARLDVLLKKNESQAVYLEKEFSRIGSLYAEDLATEAQRDAASEKLQQARLEQEALRKEREALGVILEQLREKKKRHSVFIPRGWTITGRMVEQGEVIQSAVPVARASDFRELVVPLSVSEDELAALKALPAIFNVILDGIQVNASIYWINPEFNEQTRKLALELIVRQYEGPRRGGLRLELPLQIDAEGIYIPRAAVMNRYENPTVTIRDSGETVRLLVLGASGDFVTAAEDRRLRPGTVLLPAGSEPSQDRK